MESANTYSILHEDITTFNSDLTFHERNFTSTFDPPSQNYTLPKKEHVFNPQATTTYDLLISDDNLAVMFPNETTQSLLNSSSSPLNYSNYTNNTILDEAPIFTDASLTKICIYTIMFAISLVGNVATLVQMRRLRRRRSTINTLIIHLAVADLLVTFFCIAGEAVWTLTVQWIAGNVMCKIVKYMQVFALYLSTYITVAISLDRCVAILDPMKRNGATQRVRVMIVVSWILSALNSIPQIFVFKVNQHPVHKNFSQCSTHNTMTYPWDMVYMVGTFAVLFFVPLVVTVTAYTLIFTTISKKSREHSVLDSMQPPARRSWLTRLLNYKQCLCMVFCTEPLSRRSSIASNYSEDQSCQGQGRSHLLRRAKRKSLRMSFVIVLAFIICWTPYYIIFFCITFLDLDINPITMDYFSFVMGLSNCMINPMIYGAFQLCKVQYYRHRFVFKSDAGRGSNLHAQETTFP